MPLTEALRNIHFPTNPDSLRRAQYRLKFEELFYVQLNILRYAKDRQRRYRGYIFERVGDVFNTFYSQNLPFQLTGAQKRVLKEIRNDVGSGRQMNRLLQGDVGSGNAACTGQRFSSVHDGSHRNFGEPALRDNQGAAFRYGYPCRTADRIYQRKEEGSDPDRTADGRRENPDRYARGH